jgi:hypothetical protein
LFSTTKPATLLGQAAMAFATFIEDWLWMDYKTSPVFTGFIETLLIGFQWTAGFWSNKIIKK